MEKVIIYHNPRCKKSREGLQLLEDRGIHPKIVKYLEDPPTPAELGEILEKLKMKPYDLLRRNEKEFKELQLKEKKDDRKALLEAMHNHPRLIQRPIVINGEKAALGRPPENILEIL